MPDLSFAGPRHAAIYDEINGDRCGDTVAGRVEHWVELTNVALPLVSFRHNVRFFDGGDIVTSDSTLRFRDREEITAVLAVNGFTADEVRHAPDQGRIRCPPTHGVRGL